MIGLDEFLAGLSDVLDATLVGAHLRLKVLVLLDLALKVGRILQQSGQYCI